MTEYEPPRRVFGVAVSAHAERAGEETWVAACSVDDGPRLVDCRPAVDALGAGAERSVALPDLAGFLAEQDGDAAVGMDVPFGLPADVVAADEWTTVLQRLPSWADDPQDLARESEARATTDGGDAPLQRETAEPLGTTTPFDQRQRDRTYYGLRDVLRPLAMADAVRALPMQPPSRSHPHLLEVFPAGTLARLGCDERHYRGATEDARTRRERNLDRLAELGLETLDPAREQVLDDATGRAMEAVVGAVATYQHTLDPTDLTTDDRARRIEGHVYV